MAQQQIEMQGLRELEKALLDLPKRLERRVLNSALMSGARLMVRDAKQRVPVATGELRRNIRARPDRPRDGHTATVIVGVRKLSKAQLFKLRKKRINTSDPFYWRFVEFGTSRMAARPFLRPAFESQKVGAVAVIKDALRERIDKEAQKLGRR